MDVERIIDEIEQLKEMFGAPDIGHSAQPTSLMPIEGMTKCSRIAHGSGCRNGMDFVAEAKASSGLGFRANRIPLERRVTPHTNRSTLQHQRSRNIALIAKVQFYCIDQRYEPREQRLVCRMLNVSIK